MLSDEREIVNVVLVGFAIFGFAAASLFVFTLSYCQYPYEGIYELRFCQQVFSSWNTPIAISVIAFGGTIAYFLIRWRKTTIEYTAFYAVGIVLALLVASAGLGMFWIYLWD